jgi:tetratricopeptide (TPR) repeat protein
MSKKLAIMLSLIFSFVSSSIFAETIVLKSGKTIEAKIIEKTDDSVKADIDGIPITYYLSEIDSIDGEKLEVPQPTQRTVVSAGENKETGEDKAGSYMKLGFEYLEKRDFDKAIDYCNKALEINPNLFGARYTLSTAYLSKGEPDKAIDHSMKLIELYPNAQELDSVYYNLSTAYLIKKDYDRAIDFAGKAVMLNGNCYPAFVNLAIAYFENKNYDKSWKNVHKVESAGGKLDPHFLDALQKASGRDK